MNRRFRHGVAGTALTALLATGVVALVTHSGTPRVGPPKQCPPGYSLLSVREAGETRAGGVVTAAQLGAESRAKTTCISAKHPEGLIELITRQEGLESVRSAPY